MPHRNPPDPGRPVRRITSTSLSIRFALGLAPSPLGHNVSDRNYFPYHRDTPDKALRISEVLQSRLDDRSSMIVVSKRITRLDGSFGGVVAAAIDKDYFIGFYRTFQLGPDGGISLIRNDGTPLI